MFIRSLSWFLGAILLTGTLTLQAAQLKVLNALEFSLPGKWKIESDLQAIFTYKGLVAFAKYNIQIKKQRLILAVYLRPRKFVGKEALALYTKLPLKAFNGKFGMGGSLDVMLAKGDDTRTMQLAGRNATKLLSPWGSEYSSDILSYYFEMPEHKVYDACIIQFLNVWPEDGELPADYSLGFVEQLIEKNDARGSIYTEIEKSISGLKFMKP